MFEEEGEESHVCWDEGIRGIRGFAGNSGVNPGKLKGFLTGDSVWDEGKGASSRGGVGNVKCFPRMDFWIKNGFF